MKRNGCFDLIIFVVGAMAVVIACQFDDKANDPVKGEACSVNIKRCALAGDKKGNKPQHWHGFMQPLFLVILTGDR